MRKPIHLDNVVDLRHRGLSQGIETDDFVFVATMALARDGSGKDKGAVTVADVIQTRSDARPARSRPAGGA